MFLWVLKLHLDSVWKTNGARLCYTWQICTRLFICIMIHNERHKSAEHGLQQRAEDSLVAYIFEGEKKEVVCFLRLRFVCSAVIRSLNGFYVRCVNSSVSTFTQRDEHKHPMLCEKCQRFPIISNQAAWSVAVYFHESLFFRCSLMHLGSLCKSIIRG